MTNNPFSSSSNGFSEQRKAALRRVELELDEADDIVRSPLVYPEVALQTRAGITTRSGDPGDSTFHQDAIYLSAKASQNGSYKVQETIQRVTFSSGKDRPARTSQARHVKFRRPLRRTE